MGQPQDRKWTVDFRDVDPETGKWSIDPEAASEMLQRTYAECAVIQDREGGAFILIPIRQQVQPLPGALTDEPQYVNLGVQVEHKFAPAVRPQREPEPLPEPEPIDVAPGLDPDADLVYEDDDPDPEPGEFAGGATAVPADEMSPLEKAKAAGIDAAKLTPAVQ